MSDIADGTSNTLMMAEKIPFWGDAPGVGQFFSPETLDEVLVGFAHREPAAVGSEDNSVQWQINAEPALETLTIAHEGFLFF